MIAFGTAELLLVVVSEWSVLRSLFVVPRANKFKKLLDLAGGDTKLANELIALAGGNTEVALRVTKLVGGSKMKELLPYIDDLASFEKSLQMVGNDVAVLNRLLIHTQSATKLQRILKSVPEAGKLSDEALEGVLKMSDDELRALGGKSLDDLVNSLKEKDWTENMPNIAETRKFWNKTINFRNIKVYQRDDLFDLKTISSWKEKGKTVSGTNIERMRAGLAPIGKDGKSIELHHLIQTNESSIAEVTYSFHLTHRSTIHINPNTIPSGINRSEFATWKSNYWKNRSNGF